jgi:methylenetetrahydrofolate reductase (NADPH)
METLRHWSTRHARGWAVLYRVWARCVPLLTPLLRLLGPRCAAGALLPLERWSKQTFFDCRMCGQCVLSSTGMTCPMNCGKTMRNGPCGGVRADGHCEVKPEMRCVWVAAGEGDARLQQEHTPNWTRRQAPLDARRQGRSTWIELVAPPAAPPSETKSCSTGTVPAAPKEAATAPATVPVSSFEAACRSDAFLVTVEIAPPDSHDPEKLLQRAARFQGLVDAINITDGAGANCHMSSVAAASVLVAHGFEAVCQVGCRDRNRIALQGDVLGAAALGVRNVLCLTGDDVGQGDHPDAKPVFDLDAVNLLATLSGMTSRGEYASGRRLDAQVPLFLGATANPFVPPHAERIANLQRKIDAGARFIQTQFCFDVALLETFMNAFVRRGLHRQARLIVGVGMLPSARGLRWMAEHVPGVHVPEAVTRRIAAAADQRAEGVRWCVETIQALQGIDGVAGVHLMGHRNEAALAQVIVDAELRRTGIAP